MGRGLVFLCFVRWLLISLVRVVLLYIALSYLAPKLYTLILLLSWLHV